MRKYLWALFVIAFAISACGEKPAAAPPPTILPTISAPTMMPTITPTEQILPTVTPACISAKPTQADINRALAYTGDAFNSADWELIHTVSETNVAVTWQNVAQRATVYLEAIIFPCGYEDLDLDKYFSVEYWNAIFANYDSHEVFFECKTNKGLRLYQFQTTSQGVDFFVNYWVQSDADARVIATMIVFPVESQTLLGDYSARLFPKLPNCS